MGRYLSLLLFLLTLLPVLNIDDASSVSAQSFTYEDGSYWLPDIEVKGNEKNVTCDCCGESFYDEDDLDRHIKYNSVCASFYGFGDPTKDPDDEPKNGMCYGCGKSIEECTCTGAECSGKDGQEIGNSNGGSIDFIIDGDSWHSSNNDAEIIPPYTPFHKEIDNEHLFRKNLPAKSMKQNTRMSCVQTATANMFSHMGSTQSAEELRTAIEDAYNNLYASDFGEMRVYGIQQRLIDLFMQSLGLYNIGLSEIVSSIDEGHPCLGVIETTSGQLHMVEIVGYFKNDDSDVSVPKEYQCIDPGTGEYTTVRIEQLIKNAGNIYSKR